MTSDPSLFDITEDRTSVLFEDIFSSTNPFDLVSTLTYPTADQWNLPQDDPANLELSFIDASCSGHADEAELPLIAKLRSRAPNTGGICMPEGTINAPGSEPEWQDGLNDVEYGVFNPDPEFPVLVFPDVLHNGLSPGVCDLYSIVIMYPVCDSGNPADRSISRIYSDPHYPMYTLDHCQICTFIRLLFKKK